MQNQSLEDIENIEEISEFEENEEVLREEFEEAGKTEEGISEGKGDGSGGESYPTIKGNYDKQ